MSAVKEKKSNKTKPREEFDSSTYLYWLKSMLLMRRFE
jgi:TPP-dependent pyruvate/acetoin dehydrogenase alpha subunit